MFLYSCSDNGRIANIFVQKLNNGDVGTDDDANSPSALLDLHSNYPNPFQLKTTISFNLKSDTVCEVSIYNTKGQLVKNLHSGLLASGNNRICWDGTDSKGTKAANGVYLYRLSEGKHSQTHKLCLLK
jgi:hypothetical protein